MVLVCKAKSIQFGRESKILPGPWMVCPMLISYNHPTTGHEMRVDGMREFSVLNIPLFTLFHEHKFDGTRQYLIGEEAGSMDP